MIFSATVPHFIQKIASQSMDNPVMIDLVGDSENQLPDQLRNVLTLASDFKQRVAHIENFVKENGDKKMLIFTETK